MVAAERNHHVVAGGIDLVPLAVELGLGDRDARGSKPADDGDIEADVRASGAEAGGARDGVRSRQRGWGHREKLFLADEIDGIARTLAVVEIRPYQRQMVLIGDGDK